MSDTEGSRLQRAVGSDNLRRLANAYDEAVSIISLGNRAFAPGPDERAAMIGAMIESGQTFGFDEGRLVLVAISYSPQPATQNQKVLSGVS